MRILHVIQGLDAGGAEHVVVSLVAGAREAGHDAAVASPPGSLEADLGCERFDLPLVRRNPRRLLLAAIRLRGIVGRWRPDLVHCHNPTMGAAGSLATLRGLFPRALVSVHGVPDEDYATSARVLRIAGLPVVPCGPGVEQALRRHGLRSHRTIVNGVSLPPPAMDRLDVLRSLGVPPSVPLIVMVGRLAPQKNHALAIRAISRVPGAVLVIVGSGPLASSLLELTRALGVEDRIVLTGERADARAIMGAADLVVISSHWEGMPLVALEALAARVPLVATDVRGIRELFRHELDCLLVPEGDPEALAGAIQRGLTDLNLRRRLSREGARRAALFTDEQMVSRFLELYDQLVA
jgi:glycosyltransferase involved in cell wall biosynthesis